MCVQSVRMFHKVEGHAPSWPCTQGQLTRPQRVPPLPPLVASVGRIRGCATRAPTGNASADLYRGLTSNRRCCTPAGLPQCLQAAAESQGHGKTQPLFFTNLPRRRQYRPEAVLYSGNGVARMLMGRDYKCARRLTVL